MGKAIAIVAFIVLITAGVIYLSFMLGYGAHEKEMRRDGLPGLRGRELLQRAARIMGGVGISPSIDDPEIIRPVTRAAIDTWFEDYEKANRK